MKGDIFNAVRHAQPILQAGKNGLTTDGRRWTQIEIKEIDAPVSALRLLVSGLCPLSSAGVLPSAIGVNSCNSCLPRLPARRDTNYTDWARIESGALASRVWRLAIGRSQQSGERSQRGINFPRSSTEVLLLNPCFLLSGLLQSAGAPIGAPEAGAASGSPSPHSPTALTPDPSPIGWERGTAGEGRGEGERFLHSHNNSFR